MFDCPRARADIPTLIPSCGRTPSDGTGHDGPVSHGLDCSDSRGRQRAIYTIFEGTSEIQRLVIARAISGVHIN